MLTKSLKGSVELDQDKLSFVSGTTFGSSSVGLVHVMNSPDTTIDQTMNSLAASMQLQMHAWAWFGSTSGENGMPADMAGGMKHALGARDVQSNISIVSIGVNSPKVPGEIPVSVEQNAASDLKANLQTATNADISSMIAELDGCLKNAANGSSGESLNYYVKDITFDTLVEMWMAKYFPGKFMGLWNDESTA